jgi:hypothetical protein
MAHAVAVLAGDLASEHCHSVMSAVAFDTGSEANATDVVSALRHARRRLA